MNRIVVVSLGVSGLAFLLAPMAVIAFASLDPGPFFQFPPTRVSGHWYQVLFQDSSWVAAIQFTLTVAGLTALGSTVVGSAAGMAVARVSPRTRKVLYLLLAAPLAVPPITLGISLYGLFLQLHLIGNLMSFVFVNIVLTTPLVALLVTSAALGVDPRLELASLSCGASSWRTLLWVTFPLIAPAAIAAGVLSFLLTIDEVVISSFLVGPGAIPVAVKLFSEVREGTSVITLAVATLLIASSIAFVILLIVGRLVVRRLFVGTQQNVSGMAFSAMPDMSVEMGVQHRR